MSCVVSAVCSVHCAVCSESPGVNISVVMSNIVTCSVSVSQIMS